MYLTRIRSTAEHPGKETCKISISSLGRLSSVRFVWRGFAGAGSGRAVRSALTSFVYLPHVTLETAQWGLEKILWARADKVLCFSTSVNPGRAPHPGSCALTSWSLLPSEGQRCLLIAQDLLLLLKSQLIKNRTHHRNGKMSHLKHSNILDASENFKI